jgi:uncharacterized protein (TIGR03437 family)
MQLAGAKVTIGGRDVPLIVATPGQINAVVPDDLPVNTQHQLIVRKARAYAPPESITIAPALPAIFTADESGKGQGRIIGAGGKLADAQTPAAAGESITILCTGLGAVTPAVKAGSAAPPDTASVEDVSVTIGGIEAQVESAGLAPGLTGVYVVKAILPQNVTPGEAVDVVITVAGLASAPVTMAVK